MTALVGAKTIGAGFSNSKELYRARYNYADDGGATGTYTIFTAAGECIVTDFWAVVKSACGSTGSMTLDVGTVADDNHLISAEAVANLTANAVLRPLQVFTASGTADTDRLPMRLADAGVINMDIDAAPLSGGTIEFVIEVAKA